ncbi:hypothetical protein LMG27952_04102 [Paraburkholderia hiiakae]|jgi:hypothetical protein|uniref:Uncharacterized protein n=1 Tax=Paraburkholderia hiiakae TaxID=1081782 RepID=A0ABM8NUD2_9BURK|nr:hypothetical protein [Paraburkholderia hiiakae]CAD6543879.1 hypothetical protein LMG27952_04102 [Paraburkholderia hiiakae]
MNFWQWLSHAAWAVAILLFAWIIVDALRVRREYDDDFLMSSTEGSE